MVLRELVIRGRLPVSPHENSALGRGAAAIFVTATAGAASESHNRRFIRPNRRKYAIRTSHKGLGGQHYVPIVRAWVSPSAHRPRLANARRGWPASARS